MSLEHLRIEFLCQQFQLDAFATDYPTLAQQAGENETSYTGLLEQLWLSENRAPNEQRR